MPFIEFKKPFLPEYLKNDFQLYALSFNIRRARIFARIFILLEFVFLLSNFIAYIIMVDKRFNYCAYFVLYTLMIAVNIFILILLRHKSIKNMQQKAIMKMNHCILAYITFIMAWGSAVSLVDQTLYGHLMVFMVNMIACSVVFNLDSKGAFISYAPCIFILYIGLPFFQHSSDVLIGHYVNVSVFIIIAWLCSRILYKNFVSSYYNRELLKKANQKLKDMSFSDDLTGIPNRRSFNSYVRHYNSSYSDKLPTSVIMIDIDFFKIYNDTYGHNAGDRILENVAQKIKSTIRLRTDFLARYGGEEFIIIAGSTDSAEVQLLAERIRKSVMSLEISFNSPSGNILTISLGTSTMAGYSKNGLDKCISLADKALYSAKESGRNCVKTVI